MANVCKKCLHYILDKANTSLDVWYDNLIGNIHNWFGCNSIFTQQIISLILVYIK